MCTKICVDEQVLSRVQHATEQANPVFKVASRKKIFCLLQRIAQFTEFLSCRVFLESLNCDHMKAFTL